MIAAAAGSWVLIIALFSPEGEFVEKYAEGPMSKTRCEQQVTELNQINTRVTYQFRSICVTRDHWLGKAPMPGVGLD